MATPTPIGADFYVVGNDAKAVYHVDLSTGYTAHVGDFDVSMVAVTYDADHDILYGFGTPNAPPPPYGQWDVFRDIYFYAIDRTTWKAKLLQPDRVGQDNPVSWNGNGQVWTWAYGGGWMYSLISPMGNNKGWHNCQAWRWNMTTGESQSLDTWQDSGNPDAVNAAYFYIAGTNQNSYGFGTLGRWLNRDLVAKKTISSTLSFSLSFGPVCFHGGKLYRYAYDGQGNAWLASIDLPTGKATIASAPFSAPGHAIFFLPQTVRLKR